jgi:hypothetical protein
VTLSSLMYCGTTSTLDCALAFYMIHNVASEVLSGGWSTGNRFLCGLLNFKLLGSGY